MIKCEKIPLNIEKYFKFCPADYMVTAIISHNLPALIYVNNIENPTIFIILNHYSIYVDGIGETKEFEEAITHFRELAFKETKRDLIDTRFIYPNMKWKSSIINALGENHYAIEARTVYRFDSKEYVPCYSRNIYLISSEIMGNEKIANREMVEEEVGDIDSFLKNKFGYCIIVNDKIAGCCTAEYVSEKLCGIGIAVIPEEQRKGYASMITQYFVNMCIERKIVPYWDCWSNNIASIKTAQKVNFNKVRDYEVVVIKY